MKPSKQQMNLRCRITTYTLCNNFAKIQLKSNRYMPNQYAIVKHTYPISNNRSIGNDVCDSIERTPLRINDFGKSMASDHRKVSG